MAVTIVPASVLWWPWSHSSMTWLGWRWILSGPAVLKSGQHGDHVPYDAHLDLRSYLRPMKSVTLPSSCRSFTFNFFPWKNEIVASSLANGHAKLSSYLSNCSATHLGSNFTAENRCQGQTFRVQRLTMIRNASGQSFIHLSSMMSLKQPRSQCFEER